MPGMMDTVLNLGLNDETVEGLAKRSGDRRFAYDSYRRFIQMYGEVVLGRRAPSFRGRAREPTSSIAASILDTELDGRGLEGGRSPTTRRWSKRELGKPFPQDPQEQLWGAIGAVFGSWMNQRAITYRRLHDIPDGMGHGGQRPGHGVRQHGR